MKKRLRNKSVLIVSFGILLSVLGMFNSPVELFLYIVPVILFAAYLEISEISVTISDKLVERAKKQIKEDLNKEMLTQIRSAENLNKRK